MDINKIKPCPKCGSNEVHYRYEKEYPKPSMNDHWLFGCLGVNENGWVCGLTFPAIGTEDQAIELWNYRKC